LYDKINLNKKYNNVIELQVHRCNNTFVSARVLGVKKLRAAKGREGFFNVWKSY